MRVYMYSDMFHLLHASVYSAVDVGTHVVVRNEVDNTVYDSVDRVVSGAAHIAIEGETTS